MNHLARPVKGRLEEKNRKGGGERERREGEKEMKG